MSEYNLTLCDLCAPGKIPALNRGYALVDPDYAIGKLGWTETDVGHICPACQQEQKERAARDVAEQAETQNGVAITLEEGLAKLDAELAKLFTPEATAKIQAAIANMPDAPTYEEWARDTRYGYEEKKAALRKFFGKP